MPDVISRDVDDEGYEYGFCGLRRWSVVIGPEARLLRDRVSVFSDPFPKSSEPFIAFNISNMEKIK